MKTINILLLDYDKSSLKVVKKLFLSVDNKVIFTSCANDAIDAIATKNFAFSLVSLKLAYARNWYFLKKIEGSLTPIIGLAEQDQSCLMKEGRINGINAYFTKPLNYFNFKTYLPSILTYARNSKTSLNLENERRNLYDRRALKIGRRWYDRLDEIVDSENNEEELINIGPVSICKRKKCVIRANTNVKLTPTEYKLLLLLIQNSDNIVSIENIISHIWGASDKRASEEDVKQYIYMLRKKIEENPSKPSLIRNHKGFGYMLSNSTS